MLIMPEKYYRVCLNCGCITRPRMLISELGVKEKRCPKCGVGENSGADKTRISEYQARSLFHVAQMASREFVRNADMIAKYDKFYDAYEIPKDMRVY